MSVKMAGQTISDRLLAAKHSIAGQGLAKSVCKATTEEMIGPKKKHLDYLIHCTNEPNVSIPQLANLLIERSQNTNWVVVYKALLTVHHLLCYGNERFTQYLASSNSTFQLSNFLDKSGVQAGARVGYDMSPFIRRYAKYLNEKALSYRTVAFDFCKVKRGKGEGTLRSMNADKLLKTLPVLQAQLDALLEFDCSSNDLTNGVINMCFMLLFRDLIRLFACYNDGIINLLEKYFDMNKKQCREALDLYKKFLIRMDRVAEFLKVAENVGIDKGDIPDLTKAPSSLLDALEQHLAALEGKKGSAANTPTQSASSRTNVTTAVSALSSTSSAFGSAAAHNNARLEAAAALQQVQQANGALAASIDESLKRQALAEEEAAMNQYKEKHKQSPTQGSSTNPFLSSPTASGGVPIVDLFGADTSGAAGQMFCLDPICPLLAYLNVNQLTLQLALHPASRKRGNPFLYPDGGYQIPDNTSLYDPLSSWNPFLYLEATRASDDLLQLSGNPFADMFGGAPAPAQPQQQQAPNAMWASNGFSQSAAPGAAAPFVTDKAFSSVFGESENLVPAQQAGGAAGGKVLTGDLDSSLASLAENLSINKSAQPTNKGMQWSSPKNAAKPGANWTPQPMAATTGANYRPMGPGMQAVQPAASTAFSAMYPSVPASMGMWAAGGQQPMMGGAGMMAGGGQPMQATQPPLDPFGAL